MELLTSSVQLPFENNVRAQKGTADGVLSERQVSVDTSAKVSPSERTFPPSERVSDQMLGLRFDGP